jgi:N-acetylmuramoyl-L-alanine amidase
MPSVLIEAGFLSHDHDEAYLGNKDNHSAVAKSIFNAFIEYRAVVEGLMPEDGGPLTVDTRPAVHTPSKPAAPETKPQVKAEPVSTPVATNTSSKSAAPKRPEIGFYIQLAASKTPLGQSAANWKTKVPVQTRQEDGYYKYLAGPFKEVEQANNALKDIRKDVSGDAFIVAYRDKQRISVKEAVEALQ